MLVIYLPSIPPEPPLLKGYLNLDMFVNTTPGESFDWQTMTLALKFPAEASLIYIYMSITYILIQFGNSF